VKLIYVWLVCVLVTMNSAFAMLCDKEGPSGEHDRYFFLKKKTVIKHLESEKPRYPYGMVQPVNPLIIEGCEYDLWGLIKGPIGENLKTAPTIQWIVFENYTISPSTPHEHWCYSWSSSPCDLDNRVILELHKKPVFESAPVSSSF